MKRLLLIAAACALFTGCTKAPAPVVIAPMTAHPDTTDTHKGPTP